MALKCIACKGTHTTVPELKSCHVQNNALIGGTDTKTVTKVVKAEEKEKNYQLFTFETQEARDEFVKANPNARILATNNKPTRIFVEEFSRWETVVIKTYKVIINK